MQTTIPEPEPITAVRANAIELADRWWTLALRGGAAILFGVLTFVWPALSLLVLVILWGAYALVDGVFNLVLAFRSRRERATEGQRWGWLVFEGAISILAGLVALLWPEISALALLFVIGAWAIVTGAAEIAAAIQLRKQIQNEWLLALSGIFSIVFGVLLFLFPRAGALAVVLWIGAYAIVFGGLLIALSLKLRKWAGGGERQVPTGGVTAPA
jgi:uncharacterized membrane protein HdeD (DUF308 family)